jgi:anti-sigma-K factor RskA
MSDHQGIRDLLPGYALGCLDAEEAKSVQAHLTGCAPCRQTLASFEEVSDRLSLSVPLVEPPRALEGRIMHRIGRRIARQRPSPRWLPQFRYPALAALAAVLVVALAVGNILQLSGTLAAPVQPRSAGLLTAMLTGIGPAQDAYGTIVLDPKDNKGVLAVNGLPPLDPAHQYQLWLVKDAERRSAGVFSVDDDGYGALLLLVPGDFGDFRSFGISVEPWGGSPVPTGTKVMGGAL